MNEDGGRVVCMSTEQRPDAVPLSDLWQQVISRHLEVMSSKQLSAFGSRLVSEDGFPEMLVPRILSVG